VLGVSKRGEVKGVDHLNDDQQKTITDLDQMLVNQAAQVNFASCRDDLGKYNQICLIYVPYAENGICETWGKNPKGWYRKGSQSVPLTQNLREQLRRDKRIVDFERTYCCPYEPGDIDKGVLQEYRRGFLSDAEYEYGEEELLRQAGAINKEGNGYSFTNAGILFFTSNPQRVQFSAYVRLLRFDCNLNEADDRGSTTLDKSFTGPITKQIRDLRTFLRETGFFKTYERRKAEGGFSRSTATCRTNSRSKIRRLNPIRATLH
jgi:predicted HTH transcriptional regulator